MKAINEQFSELYYINADKIYSLAYRMCGNSEDAQDVVQSTFLLAFEKYGDFRGESSEYTWLYAIAKNLCLKLLENRKKSSFDNISELILNARSSGDTDNLNKSDMKDLTEQVKEGCLLGLVRCLSFYQRAAFILHVLMEMPVFDTAKILSKSESATRTLIFRAKGNIRKFLCNNCSLYNPINQCRCENLVGFSLKQNWIQKRENTREFKDLGIKCQAIEKEIYEAENLLLLYRTLPFKSYNEEMRKLIFSGDKLIFSNKKVK